MTNRWEGKTEHWWALFKTVRSGWVLHITDKAGPDTVNFLVQICI